MLKFAPALTIAILIGPVTAGIIGTLLPAFGYLPALGGREVSLEPFRALFATPGIATSIRLSIVNGLAAAVGAFSIVIAFTAAFEGTRTFALMQRLLSPLLSVPHAAAAFGLAFVIAPSGFVLRLLSPWATGFERPPDLLILNDPGGIAMTAGLIAKEAPFLFLMVLAALPQSQSRESRQVATTLGYRRVAGWLLTVFPRIYPQIRLPVFAVIAYSVSVVDVAMILGPTTPAPLAVRLTQWMSHPDLSLRFQASAGAIVQLGLAIAAIGLWIAGEQIVAFAGGRWIRAGRRTAADGLVSGLGAGAMALIVTGMALGGMAIGLWSFAGFWPFPDALPAKLSAANWAMALPRAADTIAITVGLGLASAFIAVALALACLENECRRDIAIEHRKLALLYLPLVVPQIAFLFGLQILLLLIGLDATVYGVAGAHLTFVLPYVFLALSDPWRAVDPRYARIATAIGARPSRVFWRIRLPLALRAVATASALGFAVSIAQYLPTVLIGAGRVETVTTEAVALASGGNRRLIAIHACLQMLLPFAGFLMAGAVANFAFRDRRALRIAS
ncbi:ABC transporter permease subunit [Rhizobiales bacterium]|uniref:ABC transporter permease n=1 Tax=Hongsoonwoonella zoysiae TaxID=2821844 RepID=UPI001560A174|nr:ABC transporter permease subunit [Hongsoonwoonella zoysiae]NRG16171.1 ABC transporter permease subunit [Hongsoonwoonella zoysiae]